MGITALQVDRNASGVLAPGANTLFDTVTQSAGNISYDDATGIITFQEAGRYLISFSTVIQASSYANGVTLEFSSPGGCPVVGNLNSRTGEVTGTGILEITEVPAEYSLKNTGTGSYYYASQVALKATLVITSIDCSDAGCASYEQLVNILAQMIPAYSLYTWTVYTKSLAAYSGKPLELYTAPGASMPGLLQLVDDNGNYNIMPLENITAIYPGDGTVYDPSFTYLSPPEPLPPDCEAAVLAAIQAYLPVGTYATYLVGLLAVASGDVYRNEYGLLVLSDAEGNTPIFIPTPQILRIFLPNAAKKGTQGSNKPTIEIRKE